MSPLEIDQHLWQKCPHQQLHPIGIGLHFPVPSYKAYAKNVMSNNKFYLFGCLVAAQLMFVSQLLAQPADVYIHENAKQQVVRLLPPNAGDILMEPPSPTKRENIIIEDSQINKKSERRLYVSISEIDKEVVELLIKQWAPIVWLAPEEKFMPLGVEEFLVHVHPESKDKTFTPGMPLGEGSEKSYLVTNTDIDQLLANETSFLYGRNPNESPVPIYAVVTICDFAQKQEEQEPPPQVNDLEVLQKPSVKSVTALPASHTEYTAKYLDTAKVTRGPYIPVTLRTQNQVTNVVRRSSKLYPTTHRVKRNVSHIIPKFPALPPISSYDLVMGESAPVVDMEIPGSRETATPTENKNSDSEIVNDFIANLADNVKFSVPYTNQHNFLGNYISSTNQQNSEKKNSPAPSFHVTYWMFYPYSQGKNICTLSLGPFGNIPFPAVYGFCLGRKKDIGSHIGDWEHMTLYFAGATEPEAMYVSAHDAGAYYAYNRLTGSFEFRKQETRKGILQRPNFPKTVTTFNDHPVLFAAKGSHGIWTAPGKHRFVKVARLYDVNGFGTPWNTWKRVDITYENLRSYGRSLTPTWFSFKGRWGNPKSKCHPLKRVGLNFCEFADGPTGIPLKEPHFQCAAGYKRQ